MCRYGYTRDEKDAAARGYIDDYRQAAALTAEVKKTILSFDGKCFNCKLEKALQEKARIFVKKEYKYIAIYTYGKNRNEYLTLANIPLETGLPDGKRISAAAFIQALTESREKHLKEAYSLEKAIAGIDDYQQKIKALQRQISALKNELPYIAKEIYGI